MWPFSTKSQPAKTVMQGQPVYTNLNPASTTALLRSLNRMLRLIEYQKKTHLAKDQLDGAAGEFEQHRKLLALNDIMAPSDIAGVQKLIRELQEKAS